MAGIGFELRKLIEENTFSGDFRAYFYAGMLSAGPWVISIFSIGLLWIFSAPQMGMGVQKLFRVAVVYTYAYSLISTGALQLVITRFLADRLFVKRGDSLMPTYVGLILLTVIFQSLTAVIFYSFCDVDLHFKIIGVVLYVTVSCIWQTMIFLSAARDYLSVVAAFFWGCLVSFLAALALGYKFGFNGHLLGYTLGQVVIVLLLMYRIFCEFTSEIDCDFEFTKHFSKYVDLFIIGVFYYLAIWIDKIIYWYAAGGEHIKSLFYAHYPYDSCMFIAFLTIIPVLAHFMVDVETNFYEKYKSFYGSIVNKGTLKDIRYQKKEMVTVMRETSFRIIIFQALVTGAFIFYAPLMARFLDLRMEYVFVLRNAGLGTFFHAFLLVVLIFILYFDRRRIAAMVSVCFLATNSFFTLGVIKFFPEYMGAGYAAAAFVTLVFALCLLSKDVSRLEYLTFIEQPFQRPYLPKATETG